jgi:hypothetical protein
VVAVIPGPSHRPGSSTLTSTNHPHGQGRNDPAGPHGTPEPRPASRATVMPRPYDQDQLRGPATILGWPPATVNDQGLREVHGYYKYEYPTAGGQALAQLTACDTGPINQFVVLT